MCSGGWLGLLGGCIRRRSGRGGVRWLVTGMEGGMGNGGGGGTMMLVFSSAVMMESWRILSRGVWWDSR